MRCKDCQWVHEADSKKGTSFMGVELCAKHAGAARSLRKIRAAARRLVDALNDDHHEPRKLNAPRGYTLWAKYPTWAAAQRARKEYGLPGDVIRREPGGWALYGRAA